MKRWTGYELSLLKQGDLSCKDIAHRIGRTPQAVYMKRSKLRIARPAPRPIQFEEYEFVATSPLTVPEMANELNRSAAVVYSIARELGLSTANFSQRCYACGVDISHKTRRAKWCQGCLHGRNISCDRNYYRGRDDTQRAIDKKKARIRGRERQKNSPSMGVGTYRPWTPAEDELVQRRDISEIEKAWLLNRSCSSIHNRAHRLQSGQTGRPRPVQWTEYELHIVRRSDLTISEISQKTGRSVPAVCHKRHQMGVSKPRPRPWTSREIEVISRSDLTREEIANIIGRSAQAVSAKRCELRKVGA